MGSSSDRHDGTVTIRPFPEDLVKKLDALEARVRALEEKLLTPPPAEPAPVPEWTLPPEVESAVVVRFSGDIAAAQQTRTVAQAMLRGGMPKHKVREAVLGEGEVID